MIRLLPIELWWELQKEKLQIEYEKMQLEHQRAIAELNLKDQQSTRDSQVAVAKLISDANLREKEINVKSKSGTSR